MENSNQTKQKKLTLLGFTCMLIPFILYALWIQAFNKGATQAERLLIFKTNLPNFLVESNSTMKISIVFSALAIILSSMTLMKLKGIWRLFNILILALSCILLFLNIS